MKNKLTQEYLKEALHYDPETGIYTWNVRPENHFPSKRAFNALNSRSANKKAGSVNKESGYLSIRINSKLYLAHRLAFIYMEGYMPENGVDHVDRNRLNNKWNNLREASQKCNMQNCKLSIMNTSGVTGVCWNKNWNKWETQITINSKTKHLGSYVNFEDAVMARYQEEINNPEWTCSIDSSALKYLQENNLL